MRDSRFGRLGVPDMTAASDSSKLTNLGSPVIFCTASQRPLRVVVRNTSLGVVVFLATSEQALLTLPEGPGGEVFELPPGASETFVLACEQTLYGAALVANGIVTFAISDALPSDIGDERRFSP